MVIYSNEARFWDKSVIPWQKITIPAPYDKATPNLDTWNGKWARMALDLRKVGIGGLQHMPMLKTQSGCSNTGDGYGWNGDLDDIGTKNSNFSIPTRAGTGAQLLQLVANLNAVGIQFGANIVTHQAVGGKNGTYTFPNWAGVAGAGWTKWTQGCFRDWRGEDPVWEQPDFGFGNEFVYDNCYPAGYTAKMMIAGWQRLRQRVGFKFARLDDVKGEYLPFVREFVSAEGLRQLSYIAEDFDGQPGALLAWLNAMGVGNVSVYDFPTHWVLQQILSQTYGDLTHMNGKGLNATHPFQAAPFVDNADCDLTDGEQVVSAKRRCYAWLLTVEGQPVIYHKDYSTDSNCYGLKEYIDPMIWCHQVAANGPTITRCCDPRAMVLQRLGQPGLISAFSTDPIDSQTRTIYTGLKPGQWLRSFTGQHPDVKVGTDSTITITIPADHFGAGNSYLMFADADLAGVSFDVTPATTTQHVFGADDRDVPPALGDTTTNLWPFWCAAGHALTLAPQGNYPGVTLRAVQPDGTLLSTGTVQKTGWHLLQSVNSNTGDVPFEFAVTYMGTQGLTNSEAAMQQPPTTTKRPVAGTIPPPIPKPVPAPSQVPDPSSLNDATKKKATHALHWITLDTPTYGLYIECNRPDLKLEIQASVSQKTGASTFDGFVSDGYSKHSETFSTLAAAQAYVTKLVDALHD